MLALHKPTTIYSLRHVPSWLLLTFAAGSVNAGAFVVCQRFVTHVTGTSTRVGMDLHQWWLVLDYGIVLGCFVLGAMFSVLAIDSRFHRGKKPLYAAPLVGVSLVLLLVALLGHVGLFGPIGDSNVEKMPSFIFLSMLSFAMGLQNAAVATSTGATVRTTHLTGPATDLGVHLANIFFTQGEAKKHAMRSAALRAGKIVSFIAGAGAGVSIVTNHHYLGFIFPAVIVLGSTALSLVPSWSGLKVPTGIPQNSLVSNSLEHYPAFSQPLVLDKILTYY
jgi:uncharacterized membrane protein YoaK (UPF0700 family)